MTSTLIVCPCRCGANDVHGHLVLRLKTMSLVFPFRSKADANWLLGLLVRSRIISSARCEELSPSIELSPLPETTGKVRDNLEPFAWTQVPA